VHKKASAPPKEDDQSGPPTETEDAEAATRRATSAIAPYIVTIVRRLGGSL
jgi:hypothetical protein